MQRHSIPSTSIRTLVQQVTPTIDTDDDYKIVVRVEGGEVHIGKTAKDCFECEQYEALLEARAVVRGITDDEAE